MITKPSWNQRLNSLKKLNFIQENVLKNHIFSHLSLDSLNENEEYETLKDGLLNRFGFSDLNTFGFDKYGFLGLFLELGKKGKIAISLGESKAVCDAGKLYEELGFELVWLEVDGEGKIKLDKLKKTKIEFLFLSSYTMDTFVKTPLNEVKSLTNALIISNASANFSNHSDGVYFDLFKLSGFALSCVLLHNELIEQNPIGFTDTIAVSLLDEALKNFRPNSEAKEIFLKELKELFKDDIYFFVEPNLTLDFTLHFGLKDIKAREFIRSLALDEVFITNGEGCALGLSQPSQIIKHMDDKLNNSNAISLSFNKNYKEEEIKNIVKLLHKKYRRIRALNG